MSKVTMGLIDLLGHIAQLNEKEFQFIKSRYDTDGSIKCSVEDVANLMSMSAVNAAKYSIKIKMKLGIQERHMCRKFKQYSNHHDEDENTGTKYLMGESKIHLGKQYGRI